MNFHLRLICKISFVLFSVAGANCFAANDGIAGKYISVGSYSSTMDIVKVHGLFRILLSGGSSKEDKEDVSGDCEAAAEGTFDGRAIHAHLVPFKGEVMSLDAQDIKEMDPLVTVKFKNGMATVDGKFTQCGVGNDLTGIYRRQ